MIVDLCLSGGARGADTAWGDAARRAGHQVIHFSFAGHATSCLPSEVERLTPEELAIADPFLVKANVRLHRHLPFYKPWLINLLRRNYFQIAESERVYGVVQKLHQPFEPLWRIDGGTAWAVSMFLDANPSGEVYVFDQQAKQWFVWETLMWKLDTPPRPHGTWTGIGTRELNASGEQAINTLFV